MSINVKLPQMLVDQAKRHGHVQHRSVPKQIEHWSKIGKVVEENPDLSFSMIREILLADQGVAVSEYKFN